MESECVLGCHQQNFTDLALKLQACRRNGQGSFNSAVDNRYFSGAALCPFAILITFINSAKLRTPLRKYVR